MRCTAHWCQDELLHLYAQHSNVLLTQVSLPQTETTQAKNFKRLAASAEDQGLVLQWEACRLPSKYAKQLFKLGNRGLSDKTSNNMAAIHRAKS